LTCNNCFGELLKADVLAFYKIQLPKDNLSFGFTVARNVDFSNFDDAIRKRIGLHLLAERVQRKQYQ